MRLPFIFQDDVCAGEDAAVEVVEQPLPFGVDLLQGDFLAVHEPLSAEIEGAYAALHLAEGHDVLPAAAEEGRECLSVVAGEA